MRHRHLLLASLLLGLATAHAAGPAPARIEVVKDTYFGETIADPYRWMEQGGPEFEAFMKSQDELTRRELHSLPGYAALVQQVSEANGRVEAVRGLARVGTQLFYLKSAAGADRYELYQREQGSDTERLLIDPARLPGGSADSAIDWFVPSSDGRLLAVGISRGGSEESVLRVFDVTRRKLLGEAIDRCRFCSPEWVPGRREFHYTRLQALPADAPPTQRFKDMVIWHHRVGADVARDRAVFRVADQPSVLGHDAFPSLLLDEGGRYAFVAANSGVTQSGPWWVAARADLDRGQPHWRMLDDGQAELVQYSHALEATLRPVMAGDTALFLSTAGAPAGQVLKVDLRAGHAADRSVALPPAKDVLNGLFQARDGVYLARSAGMDYRVQRWTPATGAVAEVALAPGIAVWELQADPRHAGALLCLASWTVPADYVSAGIGEPVRSLRLGNVSTQGASGLVAETRFITARDGVQVPVSIVRRVDADRSKPAAALFDGYGAYAISSDPGFNARLAPWFARGHVYVSVHVRGGGEFGAAWHQAGKGANKPNTWHDMIDAIEALQKDGVVAPGRVVGEGTSAGGILIGRVITERPDLLAAAMMGVPVADGLRFELTPGGPGNVAEFGSVKDEAGYRALRAMSPYANVVDGTKYPAVLVTAGMNDQRVSAWVPAKMAARLQAASSSGAPVRLRVEFGAGHGQGSSKAASDVKYADMLAFFLQALGDKGFQPLPDR